MDSGSHGKQTGEMLHLIEKLLINEKPDRVLVYGDTNSTLAGALLAVKLHIPVAHVEAGLRSFNMQMPEEINRILTDQISDLLFTPTKVAAQNLRKEGIDDKRIIPVGDVMFDAILLYSELANSRSKILKNLNLNKNEFILCTIHRAENTDDILRFTSIFKALNYIAKQIKIIMPVHPRTRKILNQLNFSLDLNMILINPIGYLDMLMLEKNSKLIITDSGGIQKEAYFNQVLCVTLRDETEWAETVNAKVNFLFGADFNLIVSTVTRVINHRLPINFKKNHFGSGNASQLIVQELIKNCYTT